VRQLGLTGFEADVILHQQLGVTAELPLLQHLTFIISLGNTNEDIDKLIEAFTILCQSSHSPLSPSPLSPSPPPLFPSLSPREAFFAPTENLARDKTINRISAELICPYPPGIPVLMPGELITAEAIDYLEQVIASGGTITGCSDPTLQTLKVIE
jgi:arginine/lysine/ornithine decarboxylase